MDFVIPRILVLEGCADVVNENVNRHCTTVCKAGCAYKDGYVRQKKDGLLLFRGYVFWRG